MASGRIDPAALKRYYLPKVEIFRDLSVEQIDQIEQGFRMSPNVPKGRIVF